MPGEVSQITDAAPLRRWEAERGTTTPDAHPYRYVCPGSRRHTSSRAPANPARTKGKREDDQLDHGACADRPHHDRHGQRGLLRGGKGYPGFKAEFERVATLDNLRRHLAGFRDKGSPAFFSPMSYTDEEYDNWKHRSGFHRMFDNQMFETGGWSAEFHPDFRPGRGDVLVARTRISMSSPPPIWTSSSSAGASSTWPWRA